MHPTKSLADELFREKVQDARELSPAEKLLAGPRLFDRACRMAVAGLRHRFPEADEATLEKLLDEQLAILRRLESRS